MTIEARKYHLIQAIISIRSEDELAAHEEIERKRRIKAYEDSLKPMTKEEYVRRVLEAEKDIEEGKLTSIEDLIEEMKSW